MTLKYARSSPTPRKRETAEAKADTADERRERRDAHERVDLLGGRAHQDNRGRLCELRRYGRKKDKISFEQAQAVFEDSEALRIYDPDHSDEEDRFLSLGISAGLRMLVVCNCCRERDEQFGIISARKAAKTEVLTYERRK
jgi:uncharacterized DUF497 family protein